MNLYFLVEGRRTERRIYPKWLAYLLPHFSRIENPDEATTNTYYLISGQGYPRMLDVQLPNSVADINSVGKYDYLIVVLDADELTVQERLAEVNSSINEQKLNINSSTTLRVIVQNRCIETWLLGNRRVFPRNPQDSKLREYIAHFDVAQNDPELSLAFPKMLHSEYHLEYIKAVFRERGLTYTKENPGHSLDNSYLEALQDRVAVSTNHLLSFQQFLSLCDRVDELTRRETSS